MTRLFLATALVLHLSGFTAAAAVVWAAPAPGMTASSCCCHHAHVPGRTPVAAPACPGKMAPGVPAPATPMPATPSDSHSPFAALAPAALLTGPVPVAAALRAQAAGAVDSSPPYLTAAHPRC